MPRISSEERHGGLQRRRDHHEHDCGGECYRHEPRRPMQQHGLNGGGANGGSPCAVLPRRRPACAGARFGPRQDLCRGGAGGQAEGQHGQLPAHPGYHPVRVSMSAIACSRTSPCAGRPVHLHWEFYSRIELMDAPRPAYMQRYSTRDDLEMLPRVFLALSSCITSVTSDPDRVRTPRDFSLLQWCPRPSGMCQQTNKRKRPCTRRTVQGAAGGHLQV